jgi:hypothetical protein
VSKAELARAIADDLVEQLDEWYSLPETFDNELDRQIHEWYTNTPNVFPKRPYFSPSAADACSRELYYKAKRYPKDSFRRQPHTGRWVEIGTNVGDMIQRTLLAMERNLEDKTGISPKFRFVRNENGTPMFEDFAKKNHRVVHNGKAFYLFGTPDGIMEYRADDGQTYRVGLEIKSKQSTPARTSAFSMREPEAKHVHQCQLYGHMYDVDMYVILYVNTAHKGWSMDEEDYRKNPDIRAFGFPIEEKEQHEIFDKFVAVLEAVERNEPPALDWDRWVFNNYKQTIARELSAEEFEKAKAYAFRISKSQLPNNKKLPVLQLVKDLEELRDGE